MTNARKSKQRRPPVARTARSAVVPGVGLGIVFAVAIGLIVVGVGGLDEGGPAATGRALARTGEINAMGVPVVETPGSASGRASASGVEVRGALYDLGTVPLDVAVRPQWTLVNNSNREVALGEPTPEVVDGCCPGPFELGTTRLAPGASTTLTFELAMHAGMDGWHDIAVHLPLGTASGEDVLDLRVVGDFRGAYTG